MNESQSTPGSVPYAAVVEAEPLSPTVSSADAAWSNGNSAPLDTAPQAVLEFTPGRVARALRRRWAAAIALGLVGALAAGYVADQLVTSSYTARTQVYIPTDRPGPFAGEASRGDVAVHQRRQGAMVRNRQVLELALQRPGVAEIPIVRNNADAVAWLERELLVDFNSSPDLMRISLKGSSPEELLPLLNSVREAYLKEASNRELSDKTATLRWVRQVISDEQGKLEGARVEVTNKAAQLGAPDAAAVRLRYQNDSVSLGHMRALRFQFDSQASDLNKVRETLLVNPPDAGTPGVNPAELKAATNLALRKDPEAESLRTTIRRLDTQIAQYSHLVKPGTSTRGLDEKQNELNEAKAALAKREDAVRTETARELDDEALRGAAAQVREHRRRAADLLDQVGRARAQVESVDREIEKLENAARRDLKGIAELDPLSARVADVDAKVRAARARAEILETELAMASPHQVQTSEEAVITQVPNPAKKTWMIVGAVAVGLFGGLFGVAFLDMRAGRIDSPDGVDRRLHTGVVGCIPRVRPSDLTVAKQPDAQWANANQGALSDAADACRTLLLNALSGGGSKVIMVTSAMPGEGKTTLATQLALSLGRGGYKTLLIDADVRHPGVHTSFGRSIGPGLTDVLRKTHPVQNVIRTGPLPNLGLIPAGQCNPQEAVALFQLRMGSLLRKCKPHFEVIVLDTPPLLGLPDALVIGRHVDGTILSLMNEVSTLPAAQAACNRLRTLSIPLLGAVLNAARVKAPLGY